MGCVSCQNKITTELVCTNCNRQLSIRHTKGTDPILIAKQRRSTCSKCGESTFEVV